MDETGLLKRIQDEYPSHIISDVSHRFVRLEDCVGVEFRESKASNDTFSITVNGFQLRIIADVWKYDGKTQSRIAGRWEYMKNHLSENVISLIYEKYLNLYYPDSGGCYPSNDPISF
jgi:hypothetical protein